MDTTKNGNLATDSPSIYQILKISVDNNSLNQIARLYKKATNLGALSEIPVVRQPQASFNPKPARLLNLVLSKADLNDLSALKLAILVCCDKNQLNSLEGNLDEVEVKHALSIHAKDYKNLGKKEKIVLACYFLDLIRHLHMTKLSSAEQSELADKILREVLPVLDFEECKTLRLMLIKAIERTQRRVRK